MIRIVAVPAGEAPLWVREQWVGLLLPLAQTSSSADEYLTSGVLTGPRGVFATLWALMQGRLKRESGFPVDVEVAIAALAAKSPAAANWWRKNTPYLFRPKIRFVFQSESAEICESNARSPRS